MFAKNYAAEGYPGGPTTTADVKDNIHDIRNDVSDLAASIKRLAVESPDIAQRSFEGKIRREPVRSMLWATGAGFVLAFLLRR